MIHQMRRFYNENLNQRTILFFGLFYAIILLTDKSNIAGMINEWKEQ